MEHQAIEPVALPESLPPTLEVVHLDKAPNSRAAHGRFFTLPDAQLQQLDGLALLPLPQMFSSGSIYRYGAQTGLALRRLHFPISRKRLANLDAWLVQVNTPPAQAEHLAAPHASGKADAHSQRIADVVQAAKARAPKQVPPLGLPRLFSGRPLICLCLCLVNAL